MRVNVRTDIDTRRHGTGSRADMPARARALAHRGEAQMRQLFKSPTGRAAEAKRWTTPRVVEVAVGLEITGYLSAELA
jgi:coenzyme PQQ precursor peptide PqqA